MEARRKATVFGFLQALCPTQSQPNGATLWKSGVKVPSLFSLKLLGCLEMPRV